MREKKRKKSRATRQSPAHAAERESPDSTRIYYPCSNLHRPRRCLPRPRPQASSSTSAPKHSTPSRWADPLDGPVPNRIPAEQVGGRDADCDSSGSRFVASPGTDRTWSCVIRTDSDSALHSSLPLPINHCRGSYSLLLQPGKATRQVIALKPNLFAEEGLRGSNLCFLFGKKILSRELQ